MLPELVLLLMICVVALGHGAAPGSFYPIALVAGGALLGLIPKLPQFPFDPQLIPSHCCRPSFHQAALLTSRNDFKAHIRPISLLAIGLVIATTLAVGLALKLMVPSVPWAAAFVLGAIISPPTRRPPPSCRAQHPAGTWSPSSRAKAWSTMPRAGDLAAGDRRRAYRRFSFANVTGQFALVSAGGVLVGIVMAASRRHPSPPGRPFIEVITAPTIPYTAYIAAESVHVSGVLAVVAAGLVRGRYAPEVVSAEMRIMARSVWNILVFMLNSLIFILIGIQMSDVMDNRR
ncbi:MAG: cation:proton antiporter [Burkholderiaceae bacterium]|nr:cation:proton antiporter [Burkholderiaceae bacterium]